MVTKDSRRGGRQTKLTEEIKTILGDAILDGLWAKDACLLAGIAEGTYYRWLATNQEFREFIETKEAELEQNRIKRVRAAGVRVTKNGNRVEVEGDWRADTWFLERRFPHKYGTRLQIKISEDEAALLSRHGLTPSDLWQSMIQELAATTPDDDENTTDPE